MRIKLLCARSEPETRLLPIDGAATRVRQRE